MADKIDLSVVLPVYNNGKVLASLSQRIQKALDSKLRYEIIFVNDASRDNSLDEMKRLCSAEPGWRYLNNEINQGQNRSLIRGMRHTRGELVAVMDADLQDPPECLPNLMKIINGSTEAAFLLREGNYQTSLRMLTSKLFKSIIQFMTGLDNRAGNYFVITKSLAEHILRINIHHPVLPIMVFRKSRGTGFFRAKRNHNLGQSNYSTISRFKYAYRALLCVWHCRQFNMPN